MLPCLAEFYLQGLSLSLAKQADERSGVLSVEPPLEGGDERWLERSERHACRALLVEFNNNHCFPTRTRP